MGISTNFYISLLTEDSTSIADKSCSFAKSSDEKGKERGKAEDKAACKT